MGQLVPPAPLDQSGSQMPEQQLQPLAVDNTGGSIPVIIQQHQDIPQPALDQSQMMSGADGGRSAAAAGTTESREVSPPESNQLRYLLQRGPTEKSGANKVMQQQQQQQQQAMVINTAAGSAVTTTTTKLWVPGAKERIEKKRPGEDALS